MKPLRVGHVADLHFYERFLLAGEFVLDEAGQNIRLADVKGCVAAFRRQAQQFGVDFTCVVGDVHETARPSPNEKRAAAAELDALGVVAPVFIIDGNHDHDGSPTNATAVSYLRGRPNLYVAEEPGWWDFGDGAPCWVPMSEAAEARATRGLRARIFALPWPSRSALLSDVQNAKLTPDELTRLTTSRLQHIAAAMRALRAPGVPNLLMFHGTVLGCEVNKQPRDLQRDIGLEPVDLVGFDLTLLGHIHKRQFIRLESGTAAYSGAIERFEYGEEEEKGGFLHELVPVERGFRCESTFANTPARPFVTHTVADILCGKPIADDRRTVHRVVGKIKPEEMATYRQRLADLGLRHCKNDVKVERDNRPTAEVAMESLSDEELVRRRLLARKVPSEAVPNYMQAHSRIVAQVG